MDKKRFFFTAAALFLLAVTLVLIFKNRSAAYVRVNPAFKEYVAAFTSGVISSESTIKVRLNYDMVDSSKIGIEIKENLFRFSPIVEGKAFWSDARTIEFKPDKALKSKTLYTGEFYISKILDMPDSLKTFVWQFQTLQQAVEVSFSNFKAYNNNDLTKGKLSGIMKCADVAGVEEVKKVLSATQDGKELPVKIIVQPDRKTFEFIVDSVKRLQKPGKVNVKWNGTYINAVNTGVKDLDVPALEDFKCVKITPVQFPEQFVLIQFSDPLLEGQDLSGIIKCIEQPELRFIQEDNEVRAYFNNELKKEINIFIDPAVKNYSGKQLSKAVAQTISFESHKPSIRLLGKGNIIPSSDGLIFPFEAVNLKAVDVSILKIYENNVARFLQVNDMEGERELSRVGKVVIKKTISLSTISDNITDYGKWNRFSLDLSNLIKTEQGAIYRITLNFNKSHSIYQCDNSETENDTYNDLLSSWDKADESDEGYYGDWGYYDDYYDDYYDYYYYDYDWRNRDNPCSDSYYWGKAVSRNILASDIGLIAKKGSDKKLAVFATDLITAKPLSDVKIEVFDYQNQLIASSRTNGEGITEINYDKKTPFLIVAKHNTQRGYLKLKNGNSLSLSMFDIEGEPVRNGIKGMIYGERGVWRPGDSLYLTFILEDKENTLPGEYPVSFELINPRGQKVKQIIKTNPVNGFYDFRTATDINAPTGNWSANVKVGNISFYKNIKIETIKPNRLKILLDFAGNRIVKGSDIKGTLESRWLHGAPARNLRALVTVAFTRSKTTFPQFSQYIFDDPSRRFDMENVLVFDGKLDEQGRVEIPADFNISDAAPGVLKAFFETRVFEEGGESSVDRFSMPYYPYKSYVGLGVPSGKEMENMLETDKNNIINIVNVDDEGKLINSSNTFKVEVFKIDWRWWWDNTGYELTNFSRSSYNIPVFEKELQSVGGKASYTINIGKNDWGRYLIRITDVRSGHSTGKVIYFDWPGWAGRARENQQAASMLVFTADKEKYNVGDEIKLTIPSSEGARALVSLETGSKILKSWWVQTSTGQTEVSFKATAEMAPNIYAYVTLIQPHSQTKNDLPLRLYGVIPVKIEDPNTHLRPVIKMPDVLVPEQNASITIKEENGKPMAYTLAIVDEGLLDLTKYKTPDPWNVFYAREALGIKTWDLYDYVLGSYNGLLERLLSIGGGEDGEGSGAQRANRFKPMVSYIGPIYLKKGESKTHTIKMPQYVGSVRVMLVAGNKGAYGNAEKTVAVRKPLMLLAALPRVLGPGESLKLPVSVFAMEKNIKNVQVSVSTNQLLSVKGSSTQTISFSETGDKLVEFDLDVKNTTGIAKIKVVAVSGSHKAEYNIEVDVRNPNPEITEVVETVINAGKTWNGSYKPIGLQGTNSAVLEVSSIPPLNLENRLKYLITYPHGCLEQTTSAAFPQLYLTSFMDVDNNAKAEIEKNVKAAIRMLRGFQQAGGGMSYWQGDASIDEWGTNYAGHFLVEASLKGYNVPHGMLEKWKNYQKKKSLAWVPALKEYYHNADLVQAYRLYTLALAKAPELGAMNQLREQKNLSIAARWRLAAAYHIAGQPAIAKSMVANISTKIQPYSEMYYSYGNSERDQAMIIEVLSLMGNRTKAAPLVKDLSAIMSSDKWMSTQTTAYALIAVSKFLNNSGSYSGLDFEYKNSDGQIISVSSSKPVSIINLNLKGSSNKGKINIKNKGKGMLYARIIMKGIPEPGKENESSSNMKMLVNFTSLNGSKIDPSEIEQGTDFIAEVTILNPGLRGNYSQLALTQIFPSGWEIHNTRMDLFDGRINSAAANYIDIRDDRVNTYFHLNANQSKTFRIMLNASYSGRYYLPAFYCEAMYDNTINSRVRGQWVQVIPYRSPV